MVKKRHIVDKENNTPTIDGQFVNYLLYVTTKLSPEDLKELKSVAKDIIDKPDEYATYNDKLAGQIEKEFVLGSKQEILQPYLTALTKAWNKQNNIDDSDYIISFENAWVNLQKKYEFNPVHGHAGDLSYVLWIDIPYDLDEELSLPNCKDSNCSQNSTFEFLHNDIHGKISKHTIYVDKTWEGTIVLFQSQLVHTVYPFYTSDGYRVSISGNIKHHQLRDNIFTAGK